MNFYPFVKTFTQIPEGELLVYLGSHQVLEIAQNLGHANSTLKIKPGDVLAIDRINSA